MSEYRLSGHAVWDIKCYLIWITKGRYKILCGEVTEQARKVIRQVGHAREVSIIQEAISPNHEHALAAAPLKPRAGNSPGCLSRQ
ncbi:MAG TPA: transposase [Terriglobia bacterium]|jgi:putative transposase|nr:transposase [Terriglobia bacterium]